MKTHLQTSTIGSGPTWARFDNTILRARTPVGIIALMRHFFMSPDATKGAYLIGLTERLANWNAEKYNATNADALLDGLEIGGLLDEWGVDDTEGRV